MRLSEGNPFKTCANPQAHNQKLSQANVYENEMVETYRDLNCSGASRKRNLKNTWDFLTLRTLKTLENKQKTPPKTKEIPKKTNTKETNKNTKDQRKFLQVRRGCQASQRKGLTSGEVGETSGEVQGTFRPWKFLDCC